MLVQILDKRWYNFFGGGHCGDRTLKLTESWWNKLIFLHADTNLGNLKDDSMISEWVWPKMATALLVHETLKSVLS